MVTLKSITHTVGYPISGCQFLSPNEVILVGGGGSSKSGVKNVLKVYRIRTEEEEEEREEKEEGEGSDFELVKGAELVAGEDAPTSFNYHPELGVIACGINGTPTAISDGTSESLKLFKVDQTKLTLEKSLRVLKNKSPFDYQKVTLFDRKGTMLLLAFAEGQITVLNYPSLKPRFTSKKCENEEINGGDIDDTGNYVATASDKAVHFWDTKDGTLIQTVEAKRGIKNKPCNFRSIQFGKKEKEGPPHFFLAINAADRKRSYVSKFRLDTFQPVMTRPVAFNPILTFRINHSGTLLAAGCSDLAIRLLCPKTLRTLATLKNAHSFPVTTLAFSPDDKYLLSGSADGTCRIITIPDNLKSVRHLVITALLFLITLLLLLYYSVMVGWITLPDNYTLPALHHRPHHHHHHHQVVDPHDEL